MTTYQAGSCEVAVIGAGHAGIEAALASARLGLKTLCFTVNLDAVGNLPCILCIADLKIEPLPLCGVFFDAEIAHLLAPVI